MTAATPAQGLRLFVALDLPGAAREALARFRDDAADPAVWRLLPEASFHVTLAFLGHRPPGDLQRVTEALGRLAPWEAPLLALADALLLPPRRARVLTVALADCDGALGTLRAQVAAALSAAGVYDAEARPFRPHVTVARLRAGARPPRTLEREPQRLEFRAGAVTLYRSFPGRGRAVYEPLMARSG